MWHLPTYTIREKMKKNYEQVDNFNKGNKQTYYYVVRSWFSSKHSRRFDLVQNLVRAFTSHMRMTYS